MPGLLLCFVMRYDAYKRAQLTLAEAGLPPPMAYYSRVTYFHCSLIGYFIGELTFPRGIPLYVYVLNVADGYDYFNPFNCRWREIAHCTLIVVLCSSVKYAAI